MTRGKHGYSAAVRREAHEQEAEIGTYQRKVAELVAENRRLKEEAKTREDSHKKQIARLAVQIREGTSPALEVVQRESRTLRDERDHARGYAEQILKQWDVIVARLAEHAINVHHMDRHGAVEWLASLAGDETSFALRVEALGKVESGNRMPGLSVKGAIAHDANERRIRRIRSLRADYLDHVAERAAEHDNPA